MKKDGHMMGLSNSSLVQRINKSLPTSISMRVRLFLFLLMMVFTMISGIVVILILTGTFTAGYKENRNLIKNELLDTSQEIRKQFGRLSLQSVDFSTALSEDIETKLQSLNLTTRDLMEYPELIEELLLEEFELTYYTLQKSNCSGIFFILDTTVNPDLENSEYSRAGLYLKNMEPNIISSSDPTVTILRGSPAIGRKNRIDLHTQWSLEFDVKEAGYWTVPQETAAANQSDSLTKQYYWGTPLTFPGTSEEVILCSVPLLDSKNQFIGVCGLEISAMLFKLSYMPKSSVYGRMFTMLSPIGKDTIDISKSMLAGGYSVKSISDSNSFLTIYDNGEALSSYISKSGTSYVGYHTKLKLYPSGSRHYEDLWMASVLVPREDVVNTITRLNLLLILLLTLLIILGIVISIIFSNRYTRPISMGIEIIKSRQTEEAPKTKVQEIDDLIDYISVYKQELNRKREEEKMQITALELFAENTKSLSPAERSVFNLYMDGLTAKEIADRMYLSINTIKTHSKHIFSKLNVASREELLLYINLLKEIGRDPQ